MIVTVITKNVGDVKDIRGDNYSKTFEDKCEDYIKFDMGLE